MTEPATPDNLTAKMTGQVEHLYDEDGSLIILPKGMKVVYEEARMMDLSDPTTMQFISVHDPENRLGLITTARHPSSQAFTDWNKAIQELHDRKQLDYGTDSDPFANVREGAKELGLPGWVGCVIRMNDKMRRLNKAARQVIEGGEVDLANEGVLDSFSDMAVYSGIAHVLFEEEA